MAIVIMENVSRKGLFIIKSPHGNFFNITAAVCSSYLYLSVPLTSAYLYIQYFLKVLKIP